MSTPNNTKTTQLTEKLRSRLHGNVQDFKLNYIPDSISGDARTMFDRCVEKSIAQHGEKEVEQMLQKLENKVRNVERESELRVWETIFGPENTFKGRAEKWSEREEKVHKRAQVVREVYKKEKGKVGGDGMGGEGGKKKDGKDKNDTGAKGLGRDRDLK